jgi:hypothetical protein
MSLTNLNEFLRVLVLMIALTQLGLTLSGVAHIAQQVLRWLSRYTSLDPIDPVLWQRQWRLFFNRRLAPFGEAVTNRNYTRLTNQVLFQVSVGAVVTVLAMTGYLILSGAVIGVSTLVYASTGVFPEISSTIQLVAAASVLFSLATIFYTGDRAAESALEDNSSETV